MKVKVAAVQTKTYLEADEQPRNIEKAGEYVAEAADRGAKFVCFPETYPGPWKAPLSFSPVQPLQEMAKAHDVTIIAGKLPRTRKPAAGLHLPDPGGPGRIGGKV